MNCIPGTVLPFEAGMESNCFSVVSPLLSVTKGLTLSQVRELTGMEGSTIQNWVKRGWVKNPQGRRYGEEQVVRIMLINMLRGAMQLDKIVWLMEYINGSVEDRADDILPDKELFNLLCSIIVQVEKEGFTSSKAIEAVIAAKMQGFPVTDQTAVDKLKDALLSMVLAYIASEIRSMAEAEFDRIKEKT